MSGTTPAMPDLKKADPMDLGIVCIGLLTILFSFFSWYYHESISYMGADFGSFGASAWHGFFGWFGVLCAFAGAVILALALLGIELPFPVRLAVLGAFGAALLCTFLALFITPGGIGHGFGYWLILLLTIAGTALSFLKMNDPVTALPTATGSTPSAPPPPPPAAPEA